MANTNKYEAIGSPSINPQELWNEPPVDPFTSTKNVVVEMRCLIQWSISDQIPICQEYLVK